MNYQELVTTLRNTFNGDVRTRDVASRISQDALPQKFFNRLRNDFGAGHGWMNFSKDISFNEPQSAVMDVLESDEEISDRIKMRFDAIDIMAAATVSGLNRSLIVSGPAGVGKSFTIERIVESGALKYSHIKGRITAIALYKQLYKHRNVGNVILIDDCDSVFSDETTLNIMKAACDSSKSRKIAWMVNKPIEDEDSGDIIPSSFEYNGSMIFITNYDFQEQIDNGSKLSPHFEALMSRSHVIELGMKSKRDYIIRIKQIMIDGEMLSDVLSLAQRWELLDYVKENQNSMRELSLRMMIKLADLMQMTPDWRNLAKITCQRSN